MTETSSLAQRLRQHAEEFTKEHLKALKQRARDGLVATMTMLAGHGQISTTFAQHSMIGNLVGDTLRVDETMRAHYGDVVADLKAFAQAAEQGFVWKEEWKHCFQCDCEQEKPCTLFVTISC